LGIVKRLNYICSLSFRALSRNLCPQGNGRNVVKKYLEKKRLMPQDFSASLHSARNDKEQSVLDPSLSFPLRMTQWRNDNKKCRSPLLALRVTALGLTSFVGSFGTPQSGGSG
jgi:hypothetical protein